MNYKKLLEDRMPVTFDSIGMEDGKETESLWLADFVDDKWVEDFMTVSRTTYDIETDETGATYAKIENGMIHICYKPFDGCLLENQECPHYFPIVPCYIVCDFK